MARAYRLGPARKAANVLVTTMLRLGVGSRTTYLLTTTGRRTGRARTTPVTLVEEDGGRWLVSPYGEVGWVHNVRARPKVSLRRGRRTELLHAEEVGGQAAGSVLRRYVRQVRVTAPFFDARAEDPEDAFAAEAPRHPVFLLTERAAG